MFHKKKFQIVKNVQLQRPSQCFTPSSPQSNPVIQVWTPGAQANRWSFFTGRYQKFKSTPQQRQKRLFNREEWANLHANRAMLLIPQNIKFLTLIWGTWLQNNSWIFFFFWSCCLKYDPLSDNFQQFPNETVRQS